MPSGNLGLSAFSSVGGLRFQQEEYLVPTYEYKCTQEGSKFELWQEVGSAAPPCPNCGAPSKKVFGAPRVHFKGSGFYLTDLRAEQGKGGDKAEAKAESAPANETKAEVKAEAKPDAPAPTPAPATAATGSTK